MNHYNFMYPIDNQPTIRTIESIKHDVIALSGKDIMLKSRKREIVLARQSAMMLAKIFTTLNNTDIGRAFSKDHATTVHAIQCVKNAIETNYRPMLDIFEPLYKQYYTEFKNLESKKSEMTGKDLECMAKIKKRVTEAVKEFHIPNSIRFKMKNVKNKYCMKRILEEIIDRNTGGSYLLSSSDKTQMISEILDLLGAIKEIDIKSVCPKCASEDF